MALVRINLFVVFQLSLVEFLCFAKEINFISVLSYDHLKTDSPHNPSLQSFTTAITTEITN